MCLGCTGDDDFFGIIIFWLFFLNVKKSALSQQSNLLWNRNYFCLESTNCSIELSEKKDLRNCLYAPIGALYLQCRI